MGVKEKFLNMRALAAVAAAFCIQPTAAFAQSIDYSSLGDLFGEPVTTSATGTPQRASEVPANMTIVTAEEIRQSGSREIPEILSRVAGLDVLQTGINVFDVGVRGYQQPFQPRLLVLVDGRQVFLDDYSRTAWHNIPVNVDDIRQIEVIKGAASALYGSNAAGGVINIVTYSPVHDHNKVASFSTGTQGTLQGDTTATVNGDWGGTKVAVGGYGAHEFDTARYALDQPAATPMHVYGANSWVFQVNPRLQIFTEGTVSKSVGNTADPMDGALMGAERITTYSLRGGFNADTGYGLVTYDNYLNHSYINLNEPTSGGAPYAFWTNLFNSNIKDQFKIGTNNTFRVGLEYKYKDFSMTGAQLLESQSPALAENNFAVSGTWVRRLAEGLTWTNAARFDYMNMRETGTLMTDSFHPASDYSRNITAWSTNSDLVWRATDKDSFRLGYGHGVQLPSLINSGYGLFQYFGAVDDATTESEWQGNPFLKPTTVDDYSLDYTRKLPALYSTVTLGPYYQINHNIVSPLEATTTVNIPGSLCGAACTYGESINVGDSHGYGGEIEIKGKHPAGFRWDASYSYAYVHDDPDVFTDVGYQGSAPKHHYRLSLGYTTGPWEIDGAAQYQTSTNMLRSQDGGVSYGHTSADGYSSFSGRVGYQLNETYTFAVSGANISRAVTDTSAYPAVERQVFATLTGRF